VSRIALISGANRGIGFAIARELAERGHTVILGVRDVGAGTAAAARIEAAEPPVVCQLDVTDPASVDRAAAFVDARYGRLDLLVNNAGVALDKFRSALDLDLDTFRATVETNVLGTFSVCRAMAPLVMRSADGRIINLSSSLGSLSSMRGLTLAYRLSKTAVNAITRVLADELAPSGVAVNSVCPGWVRTELGGADAERSPEEGADTAVWLATVDRSPTGQLFKDREPMAW
jgi:NAD(P)-dependent dehydrogenase (short-subunit alcohol dehydrogenase family)